MDTKIGISIFAKHGITPGDLVNHLFFPKRLPDTEEGNLVSIETALQEYIGEIIGPMLKQQTLSTTKATFEHWQEVQNDVTDLHITLAALEIGESACLYVRKQNCTILFSKLDNQHMRIVTFRSSIPNTNVTSALGSLLVSYPETVDVVPISAFLLSPCFSKQLETLVSNLCEIAMPTMVKGGAVHVETREPSYPYMISDFVVSLLCPSNLNEFGERADREKIKFQKKLRDQINWDNALLPFRRSGFWMSAKVILQLSLREEMGSDQEATCLYKIIILHMLNSLANYYTNWGGALHDVTAQIMIKLARRSKKLCEMTPTGKYELDSLKQETLKLSYATIDKIHTAISIQWKNTAFPVKDEASNVSRVCRTKQDWMDDCKHQMESLTCHLNSERIPDSKLAAIDNLRMIDSVIQARTVNLDNLLERYDKGLSSNQQDPHLNDQSVWTYQTEWFARHLLTISQPCNKISKLMQAYFRTVFNLYASVYADPVYYSRMTITFLKFVAVLDEIAVARHPLLKQYKTGIKSEMFHSLLISDKCEMELVEALQIYFDTRNSEASNDFWLGSSNVNQNDFSVQYADQNQTMRSLKTEILAQMERDIQAKREELRRAVTECRDLQGQISRKSCSTSWNSYYERYEHDYDCHKCKLESQLTAKRKSVNRYQRPLPPQEYLRDAVVFELIIPQEIAVLRDGVIMLLEEILGHEFCLSPKLAPNQIQTQWTSFVELNRFPKTGHQIVCHLGSETMDTLRTHYNRENPDVLLQSESSFILENGLSCHCFRTSPTVTTPSSPFTFKIDKTTLNDAACYNSLQFGLDTQRPTENEALAKQYECHQDLSLKEFKAFGALRCAHRVQLRNLYAEIAGKAFSLDKEPILELIMQSVWELGPGRREIHIDFELAEHKEFALALLELLQTYGEENGTNWSNPLVLVSLSVLIVRILEINESLEVKAYAAKILQRYRVIAEEWCTKLEELLVRTVDEKDSKELMSYLLKAAISSVFTFNFTAVESLSFVIREAADITHLLKALSRLHYLVVRENILTQNPPSRFIRDLLRHARYTIPLNLERYLHDVLTQAPLNLALHQFASSKWFDAANILPSDIPKFIHSGNRCAVKKHAYQATYTISSKSHKVCVDILRGTFFVDGYPPSMLPEKFIRHPLYNSFFRSSQFKVQRVSRTFKTTDPYRGLHFEFTEGDNDSLIIRQISGTGQWYELIPREFLRENVAHDLINDFTHWFDSNKKTLHFRRPATTDEEIIENDTDYLLVPIMTENCTDIPNEWHLRKYDGTEETSRCYLVSIKSFGFQQIVSNLKKLESSDFIHVHNNSPESSVSARLWRHNLSFSLKDGLLECDNYPDFYIPLSSSGGQSLGTLVGLQSGIVLEKETTAESSGKKKMFLVQHGTLSIHSKESVDHQQVVVSGGLRNPTYFVFEMDQTLQRLSPGKSKSAGLYLAVLHAATSSPWPDPFTQLTGAEMATWILQSAYVWSCSPYDKECTETLRQISSLSPAYKYYPDHLKVMQVVTWPKGLEKNSYAAYDGYAIIVEKLMKDSRRLAGLFPQKPTNIPAENTMEVCHRSYYRNINMYNKAAHLTPDFAVDVVTCFKDSQLELQSYKNGHSNLNDLATLGKYRQLGSPSPVTQQVESLIMTSETLPHCTETDELTKKCLPDWLHMKFRDNWLRLFALSLNKAHEKVEHELTFILGALLYSGKGSFGQLLNLHNVSVGNQHGVPFPTPPISLTDNSYNPLNNEFKDDVIKCGVQLDATQPPSSNNFKTHQEYTTARENYNSRLQQQVAESCRVIRTYWPQDEISFNQFERAVRGHHLLESSYNCRAHKQINQNFKVWFNNRNLKLFISKVDGELQTLGRRTGLKLENEPSVGSLIFEMIPDVADNWSRNEVNFENPTDINSITYKVMSTGALELPNTSSSEYLQQRNTCIKLAESFLGIIQKMLISGSPSNEALTKAGVYHRLAPVSLLREKFGTGSDSLTEGNCNVRALAVAWVHLRRLNRIIMFSNNQEKYSVELTRELETRECENWNPLENPEWLLLELELDITIRPIQVEVARRMMEMPNGKNGTMQLNMGEGKTSVIIPMIVAALSSRKDQVCRVTVLNSIFATNFNLLGVTIGGLLDKRLYAIPCNRDLHVSSYLNQMQSTCDECLRLGGVIMTLPEYRLSFRLQMYNNFLQTGKETVGQNVYNIEAWLRNHARDLVDESDEIFSVKYQLIYTTGKQLQIDGGSSRWSVCQKLLEFLPHVASQLFAKFGSKVVEFDPTVASSNPEKFTHFRILDDEAKQDLNELMVNGILEGKVNLIGRLLTEEERDVVKEFLANDTISEETHNTFLELDSLSAEKKKVLLLVSGYLRRGILFTALKKRWRVEYGVKKAAPNSSTKLMAVPFRAKDVAAERTEFGHPDVAILLTQLSYFYSGLDDNQLLQCFQILEASIAGPETVYNSWIKSIPPKVIKSETVKTYQGVNLQDYEQRKKYLFPILRKHRAVVNFYLENVVFPKESKQFPGKLVTNAWDLCYERSKHPTTGFSGTNDTSLLLPAQISQQDLDELVETNTEMEKTLERAENLWKRSLEMGVDCKTVLELMVKDDLRVLIDAGALMLQLGNEEIAQLWLDLDKQLKGVVYFNEAGEMVIKVRRFSGYRKREKTDKDAPLALSSFKDSLENCAVYLDDQHTRGTDVKLPTSFKACVTVGSGMRRDKLIQACMRMRKLGKGQSVHFYLSHEVHNKVLLRNQNRTITVDAIINWTKENSYKFEKDGLVYWATNARNYAKNLAADDLYELSGKTVAEGIRLGGRCEDPDAQKLQVMYGTYHEQTLVTSVVPMWFQAIPNLLIDYNNGHPFEEQELPFKVLKMLDDVETTVLKKCEDNIPEAFIFHNMLDEEQEKELEPEQEVEQEKFRPPPETPLPPELHASVQYCVTKMNAVFVMEGISRLCDIFRDTSVKNKLQTDGWGEGCFATEDFIKAIKKSSNSRRGDDMDSFLKGIRFVVSFKSDVGSTSVLLLSQFEVNCLVTELRERHCSQNTSLHMFSGRWMDGQPTFVNDLRLQLPIQRELSEEVLAPLMICAGNLYFGSMQEQRAFARFLGLRLRPWKEEEEAAFNERNISSSGFVSPSCPTLREGCNFLDDPIEMMMGILKIRNDVIRDWDHVVTILDTCAYLSL